MIRLAGLLAILASSAAAFEVPERGTMLRRDLMNAVRPLAEQSLGDPVIFVVHELRYAEGKAFAALSPVRPGGGEIPWAETRMAQEGDSPDFYDGFAIHVLYRQHGQNWSVADWSIGATDVWWAGGPACAEFKPVLPEFCP